MQIAPFRRFSPLLDTIGKKLKIDAHYFAKNSTLSLLSQAVGILRGVVTGYLVARLFEKSMYGEYQFVASMMGTFAAFNLSGLTTATARSWAKKEGFSLKKITLYQLRVSLIGSLALLLCIPFLGHYDRASLWPLFIAAAILFPLPQMGALRFGTYALGQSRFDLTLLATVLWSAVMIIGSLLVVFFYPSALLILIVSVASAPIVYLLMSTHADPGPDPTGENTRNIIRYGWLLTFATIPNELSGFLDKILISKFFGLSQLALFSVAIMLPEQVKSMVKQMLPVSFPKQAALKDGAEVRAKLTRVVSIGTLLFAGGILIFCATSWLYLPLLFPKYDAESLVKIANASAVILIFMPANLFYQYMEAQRWVKALQWTQWISSGVFCLSLVILIPTMGLLGAIISRGILRFSLVGMAWWFIRKKAGEKMHAPLMASTSSSRNE